VVARPRLFENERATPPPAAMLRAGSFGEGGWLKAMRLEGYTFWTPRWPRALEVDQCAIQDHEEDPSLPVLVFLVSTTNHAKEGTA
jgi:hypothetical protein